MEQTNSQKSEKVSLNFVSDSIEKGENDTPNFSIFDDSTNAEHGAPSQIETPIKRGRGRPKGSTNKSKATIQAESFSIEYASVLNKYVLAVAGTIAKKDILPSPEESAVLDKSLCDILNKYAPYFAKYGIEAMYLITLSVLIIKSPSKTVQVKDEKAKQDNNNTR